MRSNKYWTKHFGCARFVHNYFLNERKEQYAEEKESDNYYGQARALTELKKQEETEWLNEINSQSLQFQLSCLDTAFKNFFMGNGGFSKFKSKYGKNAFTVPQNGKTDNHELYIPKFKAGIKINLHRGINGETGKMTISKTYNGTYYVSVFTEQEVGQLPKTDKTVGIDLGIKDFAITSDGKRYKNHKYTKKYERKLVKERQHLCRKEKGSNSYKNQRRKVARIHGKVSNSRQYRLHKISKEFVETYDTIVVETLNVKGMIKNRKLSEHIAYSSWGTFVTYLNYKCDW